MLTDTHAHLDSLEDPEGAVERARSNGVERIISISSGLESSKNTLAFAGGREGIYAAVGVHPHAAASADAETLSAIEELAGSPGVVAIGETGLDYFYMNSDKETQIRSFTGQIDIARRRALPIVIHVRDADEDLVGILKSEDVSEKRGVIHCFTGNYETAKRYLDLGFYISFSGIVTFKRSDELRAAAARVPSGRILIETDSPYLAPVPFRGKPNEPAYVRHTAETVAEVRGLTTEELARLTSENASRLFGLGG